jgi:hypothetical protein
MLRFQLGCFFGALAAIFLLVAGGAPRARADFTDTTVVYEEDGFPGVCSAPCFSVEVRVDFYDAGSPAPPGYCGAGEDTYVYTLSPLDGTLPPPEIPVTEFEGSVDDTLIASGGWIGSGPGPADGVSPISFLSSPLDVVNYGFPSAFRCPDCLQQSQFSDGLYLCADAATTSPTSRPDNCSITAILLDAPGECVLPGPEEPGIVEVDIDIKPGSDPNSIACSGDLGTLIPVAILTTDTFDATTVDHETVTFEGAMEAHQNPHGMIRHEEDVDDDGDLDLVLHFIFGETSLTEAECPSTEPVEGVLTGETFDGQAIEGSDTVRLVLAFRGCGLGSELFLLLPPLMWLYRRRLPTP